MSGNSSNVFRTDVTDFATVGGDCFRQSLRRISFNGSCANKTSGKLASSLGVAPLHRRSLRQLQRWGEMAFAFHSLLAVTLPTNPPRTPLGSWLQRRVAPVRLASGTDVTDAKTARLTADSKRDVVVPLVVVPGALALPSLGDALKQGPPRWPPATSAPSARSSCGSPSPIHPWA